MEPGTWDLTSHADICLHPRRRAHPDGRVHREAQGRLGDRPRRDRVARGARSAPASGPTRSITSCSATCCRAAATPCTRRATSRLKAGLPVEVPALTVNRLCGSGIQAAISGAQMILLGEADVVLTGGTESMSQTPHVIRGLRSGLRLGHGAARGHAVVGAPRHALRLHDGRHRGELRRQVRHLARGAGRLRRPQPAAGRARLGGRPVRRRGRAGRGEDAQRRGAVRPGRPPATRARRSRRWRSCPPPSARTAA